ncbi:uncharacterized protein LOC101218503 isoform X2 [Cucumis sativus]|uniref:uncharacterized protein LOC101218503 isoform X2 n=1 Tax=Cucumis sativus TaxID=3659 RepID=UPI0012F4E4CA|nr:uncharacterized protein LOC101218503 isoform X2 [Cucumis sativus]
MFHQLELLSVSKSGATAIEKSRSRRMKMKKRMRKSTSFPSIIPNYNSLFEENEDDQDERSHTAWNRLAATMFKEYAHLETHAKDADEPSDHNLFQIGAATRIFLYQNALKGEWEYVELLLDESPNIVRSAITRNRETILHIAAGAKQIEFVVKLLNRMSDDDMILQNEFGNTALCFAAASGVVRIAELMVEKNPNLPLIRGFNNAVTPLFIAVSYKCTEMVSYLLSVTDLNQLGKQEQIELLIATIQSDFYDISLWILQRYPYLAIMRDTNEETALHVIARKPSAMDVTKQLSSWTLFLNSRIYRKPVTKTLAHELVVLLLTNVLRILPEKKMLQFIKHPTRLLNDAACTGNVEFLIVLIRKYPDIIWEDADDGKSIFHVAIENRLENVFNLINEIGRLNEFTAKYRTFKGRNYNILHLAGHLATPNHLNRVSGAALQMQREMLWFKF